MNKWKALNRVRRYWVFVLLLIGVILIVLSLQMQNGTVNSLLICFGTTFMSASITIFLVKFDIMDMMQNDKLDMYGIFDICGGRDSLFNNNQNMSSISSWKEFLEKSSDKTIDIVGISMYSFLYSTQITPILKDLADKNYKIRIVLANPKSNEVSYQTEEEHKPTPLDKHIIDMRDEILRKISGDNLEVYFSKTMPRAFVVRSGKEMIITPYLLNGPFKEPTLWVKNTGSAENTYYDTYKNYIDKLCASGERQKLNAK